MADKQVTFYYLDSTGKFATSTFMSATDGLGINVFMRDLSNAGVLYDVVGVRDLTYQSEGAAAPYPSVTDWAQLTFQDAYGYQATLLIPAPLASIFASDGVTIDPTVPNVALLILNAITGGALLTAPGNPCTSYLSGSRIGRNV